MPTTADYRSISKNDSREANFPAQISSEFRVHFNEDAYSRMKKHTDTTNEVELCGVLIGEVCHDSQGFFLQVSAIIEGEKAANAGAQVTFTHQTWDHINAVKDKEYPKKRIVGWYHTHPGFGVFLSGMDLFIQESYFNHPFQVAVVVETKQNTEGCFAWVNGKSTPLTRYWVGSREIQLAAGTVESIEKERAKPAEASPLIKDSEPHYDYPPARGISTLALMCMGLLFLCGVMLGRMQAAGEIRETVIRGLENEVYSLLEFASLNVSASKDFAEINEKIIVANQKIAANDPAKQELKDLSAQISNLEQTYAKKRSSFREGLTRMMYAKQTITERLEAEERHQNQVDLAVANLYLMRVGEMLQKDGKLVDPATMDANQRIAIKQLLDKAIKLAPEAKSAVEQAFPKLLEVMYPELANPQGPASK